MLRAMSAPPDGTTFTIAHLSDLHCGGQYFVPGLLERAISEINDLKPDIVVCSGDLTTFGFKHEYEEARRYLDKVECESMVVIPGNHDSRNVGYVHFEELFGDRNSVLRVGPATVVAVDSTEPDLDHGQIGRGRYRWIEEQFAAEATRACAIFVCHHHLLPVPGTGPRAERDLRRRRHDRVPPARRRPPRPLRATSTFPTRGSSRTSSSSTPAPSPRCASGATRGPVTTSSRSPGATSPSGASTRSTDRSGSSSSRSRRSSTRSTPGGSRTRSRPARDARAGPHRRRALRAGRARLRSRSSRTTSSRRTSSAAPRSCAGTTTTASVVAADLDAALAEHRPGARRRPLRRAGARPEGAVPAREPRARGRAPVRRRRLPLRPAGARAVPAAVDRDRRHRQAGRQDGDHRARGPAVRPRPARRRRRDGAGRPAGAGGRHGRAGRRRRCSSSRAAAATPPPTTSRPPRWPASRRSAAGAAAAGSPVPCRSRTCPRARGSRPSSGPSSSSSTAAARRSRRRRRRAASSSSTARPDPDVATGYLNEFRHLALRPRRPDDGRAGNRLGGAVRPRAGARRRR